MKHDSEAVLQAEPLRELLLMGRTLFPASPERNVVEPLLRLVSALAADGESAVQAAAYLGLGLGVPPLLPVKHPALLRANAHVVLDRAEAARIVHYDDHDGTCTVAKESGARELGVQLHRLFVAQDHRFLSFTHDFCGDEPVASAAEAVLCTLASVGAESAACTSVSGAANAELLQSVFVTDAALELPRGTMGVVDARDLVTWDLTQRRAAGARDVVRTSQPRGYSAWPLLVAKLDRLIAHADCVSSTAGAVPCTREQLEEGAAIVDLLGQLIFHCPLLTQRIGQHVCVEIMAQDISLHHRALVAWAEQRRISVGSLAETMVAHDVDSVAKMRRLDDDSLRAMGMAAADCADFRAAVAAAGNGAARFRAGEAGPPNAGGLCKRIARLFMAVGAGMLPSAGHAGAAAAAAGEYGGHAPHGAAAHALASGCLRSLNALARAEPGCVLRAITTAGSGVGNSASFLGVVTTLISQRETLMGRYPVAREALGLLSQLHSYIQRERVSTGFHETFAKFDGEKSGRISQEQFQRGLRALGLDISERAFRLLLAMFDAEGTGQLD